MNSLMRIKAEQTFGALVLDWRAHENNGIVLLLAQRGLPHNRAYMTTRGFYGDAGVWFVWSHYGMTEKTAIRDFRTR